MNKLAPFRPVFLLGLLFIVLMAAAAVPTHAVPLTTWYVDAATGDDNNDCLSPLTACLTIGAAMALAGDNDTIQIAAGIYQESVEITRPLLLSGAGSDETFLDGGDTQRVVTAAHNITLRDLTVRNGRVTNADGGGIFNIGTLTLQDVRVVDNTAVNGGGSGIYNSGNLVLIRSEVSGNNSESVGGGIFTWYGSTLSASLSRISGNSGHQGGGIYNLGMIDINDSAIKDNSATGYSGGGLINFGGVITLTNVTLSGNQTVANGGGISNQFGSVNLINATLSGNSASQYGGLANEGVTAETTLLNSTIAYNTATGSGTQIGGVGNVGSIDFRHTIVADNNGHNCLVEGNWTSSGHNLASDAHCAFNSSGDLPNTPAGLVPLAGYNESPVELHALMTGSAAIDAGENGDCPAQDGRGVNRPVDGDNDGTATCDIGAFEVRSQLTVADVTVEEGDSGTTTAVFTVTLFPPAGQDVTVAYETADGSALANSDYIPQSGTLTFTAGQTEKTVTIAVIGDVVDEPDETFSLHLTSALPADIIIPSGVGTIVDNDGLPALTVDDATVNEGDSATAIAQFTITLSPAVADTVTVDVTTSDGTAVAGSDYTAVTQTLTFAPGQTTQQVEVTVHGDMVDEGTSETFQLNLTNAVNAIVTEGVAVGTILDDDVALVGVQPGPALAEGNSGTTTAEFTLTLSRAAAFPVTVDYETRSGPGSSAATPGVDYEPISGMLSFAPGTTSQTVAVIIYGDVDEEPDEQFDLFLSNADPVPFYANVSTATILNDEGVILLYLPAITKP